MSRARLLRYSRYQLEDFAIERAIVVLLLTAVNLAGPILMARELTVSNRIVSLTSSLGQEVLVVFSTLILLAVIFSSQDLISRPRKAGYYRLTFSKPVNPVWFQAQLFTVHLAGTVLLVLLIAAIFSVFAAPLPLGPIASVTAITFVLFGGIGFLISSFIAHDSLVVILFLALSYLGKALADRYTGIIPRLANVLVPTDHLAALKPMILGSPVHFHDMAWVIGYGMTAFLLGLLAVRYCQLAD